MGIIGSGIFAGSHPISRLNPVLWLDADRGVYQDAAVQFTAADIAYLDMTTPFDPGTQDFSVSVWVYFDSLSTYQTIFRTGAASDGVDGIWIAVNASGDLILGVNDSVKATQATGTVASGLLVATWYHVVINCDRSGNATAVLNGVTKSTLDISEHQATLGATMGYIGCRDAGTDHLDGRIDSFGVWNRLLTSTEITDLYNAGDGLVYDDLTDTDKADLASWWDLGEESGTRYDSHGENHLSEAGDAIGAGPGIARGRAMDANFATQLNGTSQYYSYSGTAFNPGTGDFSLGLAYYLDSLPAPYVTISSILMGIGTAGQYVLVEQDPDGTINIDIAGTVVSSTLSVSIGEWNTLLVTFDRDGNCGIVLNGETESLGSIAAESATSLGGNLLRVGCNSLSTNYYVPGRIDNAFYANRLLTSDEALWLHNTGGWRQWDECGTAGTDGENLTGSVIKGFWEFDDATSLGTDSSGNTNDLTPQGTPIQGNGINYYAGQVSYWEDRRGNENHVSVSTFAKRPSLISDSMNGRPAISFDGIDDYLRSTFTLEQPFTVAIAGRFGGDSEMLFDGVTATTYIYRSAVGVRQAYAGATIGGDADDGDTHVLLVVFNGASSVLSEDGSETAGDTGSNDAGGVTLGVNRTLDSYFLDGEIAEVAVFPAVLNATQRAGVASYLKRKYGVA